MEFKPVKAKLNLLYTGSLLIILIIFIIVLYVFISGAIKNQEIQQLNRFYEHEEHELVEENMRNSHDEKRNRNIKERRDDHYEHVEYKPERDIFYYVFDTTSTMVKGEETVRGLAQYIYRENLHSHRS